MNQETRDRIGVLALAVFTLAGIWWVADKVMSKPPKTAPAASAVVAPGAAAQGQTVEASTVPAGTLPPGWADSPAVGSTVDTPVRTGAQPAQALPPVVPSEQTPPAVAAPVAASSVTAEPLDPRKTEAYWRERGDPIRRRIDEAKSRRALMTARIAELTDQLYDIGPLNTRRGGVETERQRLISERDELDRLTAIDIRAFKDLEEEGRRAGALPGWFR